MKTCDEEHRLDIKICGAKSAKIIKPKVQENSSQYANAHEIFNPSNPHIYYEENSGSGNLQCSYNSKGEWQCGVQVGITW